MPDLDTPSPGPVGAAREGSEPEPEATMAGGLSTDRAGRPEETIPAPADRTRTGGAASGEPAPTGQTLGGEVALSRAEGPIPAVPGYEILGELGRGGMGVVYHARQLLLNRPCALKMILAGARADAVAALRFLGEAEAVARLRHPNVVQIHHIGQVDGLPYLELEFVAGGSLDRALDGTPRPARRAATLVEALARGVAEAHRLGVVHRDLKPANILLEADGTPKIADFGLAKSLSTQSGLTATDSILGSPSYMAPEQAEGRTKQVGPAADIYALGAILYELLTGRPPFRGATVLETLEQVKHAEPVPPRRLVPGLPRDAETIALRCLEKDPTRRYPSAAALADDLRRFLDGAPIAARPVRPWERAAKWARRRPVLAALIVAVHLLLASLLGLGAWSYAQIRRSLAVANAQRSKAERLARTEAIATGRAREQAKIAGERAEELRRRDYIGRVNLALRESRDNNVARALELLDGCPEDLRGWEWAYVRRQCHLDLHTFRDAAPSVNAVAFSPDGRLVASGSGNVFAPLAGTAGDVLVRDAATGSEVFARRGLAEGVRAVAFSPDGRGLAVAHARELVVWELPGGRERFRRTEPGHQGVAGLAFSPDGRSLLAGYGHVNTEDRGYARLLDAATGAEIGAALPGGEGGVWGVAFSPDGRQVALTMTGRVQVRDVTTRALVHDLRGHDGFVYAVAFGADGRFLASAGLDRTVRLYDRRTGAPVRTLTGHEGFVRAVAFSPDSRRLVSGAEDKTVKIWSVDSEREPATFHGHAHFVNAVAYNADGYRVASGGLDGEVKLWFATPSPQLTYPYHDGHVRALAIHPDGRRVASAAVFGGSTDSRTALWDLGTGEAEAFLPTSALMRLSFSPDGRRLATGGKARRVEVWDLRSRTPLHSLSGHDWVFSVAFSPDGRRLASGGGLDKSVRVWDAETGRLLRVFEGVGTDIWGLAFSPDGRLVAAAQGKSVFGLLFDGDRPVRVWDVESGREVHRLPGHAHHVQCVAFFPDGRRLVTTGGRDTGGGGDQGLGPGDGPPAPGALRAHRRRRGRGVQPRRPPPRHRGRRSDDQALGHDDLRGGLHPPRPPGRGVRPGLQPRRPPARLGQRRPDRQGLGPRCPDPRDALPPRGGRRGPAALRPAPRPRAGRRGDPGGRDAGRADPARGARGSRADAGRCPEPDPARGGPSRPGRLGRGPRRPRPRHRPGPRRPAGPRRGHRPPRAPRRLGPTGRSLRSGRRSGARAMRIPLSPRADAAGGR